MSDQSTLQIVEVGMLAGLRPSFAVAASSLAMGFGAVDAPEGFAFLAHPVGMVLAVAFAIGEWLYERDHAVGAETTMRFVRVGLALAAAVASQATVAQAQEYQLGSLEIASGGGTAMTLALVRSAVRERIVEYVEGAGTTWIARLEDAGFLTFAIFIVLFPLLPLLILLLLALGSAALFAAALVVDRTRRRPCPACGHAARVEALRCPACQEGLDPAAWLRPPERIAKRVERLVAAPPPAETEEHA
ncbi:MAG TPA: zinc ribbon domain-containing protein [Polyangiaceae bacterium LLY-WYZ-15_(1-7)]|nr:hypothetical protein [Sandaracinus sp.]MBJ69967.1 hypothetical protein [Sandaracinus sp.]HJL04731.1 zinc ribbon domain-containing protein [Polyangiaceae bacterium LLY-WYZ-15_(1-7)]HJL09704.1 zinc ribbon domain-containing protein [Polyangiaceae bacterium LLY-WYZ-15_(1-7)]HJL26099.1 zinc ribbon domain-containing protein [Polyangiaceae bacterium LLY-WYZ-15_(1-7)]